MKKPRTPFPDIGLLCKVIAGTMGLTARESATATTFSIARPRSGMFHIEVPTRFVPRPTMPDVEFDAVLDILRGGLCHEAAGHGRHTDFEFGEKWMPNVDHFTRTLANIIEDRRIEDAASMVYPGARSILAKMVVQLEDRGFLGKGEPSSPASAITQTINRTLRTEARQPLNPEQTAVAVAACHNIIGPTLTDQILEVARDGATCAGASTKTASRAAEKIVDMLRQAFHQQQEQQQQQGEESGDGSEESGDGSDSGSGEGAEGKPDADQGKGDAEGQPEGNSEGDSKDATDGQPKGKSKAESKDKSKGESEGESKGQSKEESDGDANGDSREAGGKKAGPKDQSDEASGKGSTETSDGDTHGSDAKGDAGGKPDTGPDGKAEGDNAEKSNSPTGGDSGGEVDGDAQAGGAPGDGGGPVSGVINAPPPEPMDAEAIAKALADNQVVGDLAELLKGALASLLETRHQSVNDLTVHRVNSGDFKPSKDQASLATRLRSRLADHLRSRVEEEDPDESERGFIAPGRLVDAMLGDPRLFEEDGAEGEGLNTAVQILVDASGSMRGEPADSALAALYACGSALGTYELQGVKFGVASFNSELYVLKGFTDPWPRTKGMLARYSPFGGTYTPQAIRTLLPELCLRREKRKILLLITDGDVGADALAPILEVGRRNRSGKVEFRALLIGASLSADAFDKVGAAQPGGDLQRAIFDTLKDCF